MNIIIKEINPTNNAIAQQLQVATTEFVQSQVDNSSFAVAIVDLAGGINSVASGVYAPLNNPQFSGVPTVPTPHQNNNSNQIANTAFVKNALNNYGLLDSNGKLLNAVLPENLEARLSVLSDTDTVLSQVVLYPGELASPTDRNYLRKGDGIAPGGTIVGQGNSYIQDFIPTTPPICTFNAPPNQGQPLFNGNGSLQVVPGQSIYSFINNSGTFFDYPGLWLNSFQFMDIMNIGVTGAITLNHVVGILASLSVNSTNACDSLICPDLKVAIGVGIGGPTGNNVTTISFPELEYIGMNGLAINGNSLSIYDVPKLDTIAGPVTIATSPNLTNLSLPNLRYITGNIAVGQLGFGQAVPAAIKKFDAPSLIYMLSLSINNAVSLSGIYLPSIQVIGGTISCSSPATTNLVDINLGPSLYHFNGNITCTGQKLTSTSIENVFVRLSGLNGTGNTVAYSGTRSINFSGGTSVGLSSLSATALFARTTLVNRGVTVTLNA